MKNKFAPLIAPYFDWLTKYFGPLANEVIKNKISADILARDYLKDPTRREHFQDELPHLYSFVEEFWQTNSRKIDSEIHELPGLKARFGGDIGPQVSDSIFQRTGLYFESIIVPDPLLRIKRIPDIVTKTKDYYFLKYCITHVLLKDVYLSEVYPPIAILAGDVELENNNIRKHADVAKFDCVLLTNDLYGKKFDNFTEVQDFFNHFSNIQEAIKEAQKPELLCWDEDTSLDPIQQWEEAFRQINIDWNLQDFQKQMQGDNPFLYSIRSRMLQSNMVMFGASMYDANPIIAAPVSFHWLNWKIRVNRDQIARSLNIESDLELALTNALLSSNLKWLSNVPIHDLIELRKRGQLSELRSVIRKETERLEKSSIDNLGLVTNQVDYNLSSALEKHQDEIRKLDKEFRSEMSIIGPTFLLSIAGAFQPLLVPLAPQWVATMGTIIGTTSLAAMVPATLKYLRERKLLGKSPIGILWSAKKNFKKRNGLYTNAPSFP